jgi:L-lactate dehydrogenase complex protein LldG
VDAAPVSAAREAILAQVRAALAGAPPPLPDEPAYRRRGDRERSGRLDLLSGRLADYRAETVRVGPGQLRQAIEAAFVARGARRVGIPAGLPPEWRPRGLELVVDDGRLAVAELDRLDGVLTGCTLAIAETGTLVLTAGTREGSRALTLVPDLHVCVVADEQVVEVVPEAIAALADLVRVERRPLTFVSGPSATSDIELRRVEGVHGPRTLVVLLLDEELP